ncbi:hypothetical protein [Aureivirga sp. CE67]|uniref:hypothetical protein n=1 Tax=Aureivirga sp. CE67 TaxID=1788983 RepID=UPI0018CB5918|nr:hypothetical protein [Aureivirga sp. CE67]
MKKKSFRLSFIISLSSLFYMFWFLKINDTYTSFIRLPENLNYKEYIFLSSLILLALISIISIFKLFKNRIFAYVLGINIISVLFLFNLLEFNSKIKLKGTDLSSIAEISIYSNGCFEYYTTDWDETKRIEGYYYEKNGILFFDSSFKNELIKNQFEKIRNQKNVECVFDLPNFRQKGFLKIKS